MTDEVENLVPEMREGLRNELRDFRGRYEEDMTDLKARMSSLEGSMVSCDVYGQASGDTPISQRWAQSKKAT